MSNKDIRKLFIPIDAIERHENFNIWYEDGYDFCTAESDWVDEKSRVFLNGPMGGMIAKIKPDFHALDYDVRVDKWTYTLKTYTIFQHYFFEGMMWQMYGTISSGKAWFINENSSKKDVYIYKIDDFKGRGPCYEVRVRDIHKLRPAAGSVVALMIKEHYRGLSHGENDPKENIFIKTKNFFMETGYTPEQIEERTKAGRNAVIIPDKHKK